MTDKVDIDPLGFVTPELVTGRDLEAARRQLRTWLSARLPGARDLRVAPIKVPQSNGVANETLVLETESDGRDGPKEERFVIRLATDDPLFPDPTFRRLDVETHFKMYATLGEVGLPVPEVIGFEDDAGLLGQPFFVMRFVEGAIPSDRPHYSLAGWVADASEADRRKLWENSVRTMAALHMVDPALFAFLERPEDGSSGFDQCLDYWWRYYDWARGERSHPVLEEALDWITTHLPRHPPAGLAWGDARIPNMIYRDFRCVAILDWDMVSLGGAEVDLGWWILQEHGSPRHLAGLGTPRETVSLWEETTGRRVVDLRFYVVFNALRLASIRIRLARRLRSEGRLPPEMADLETNNVGIQQLALLLGLTPPGPVTTSLPDIE